VAHGLGSRHVIRHRSTKKDCEQRVRDIKRSLGFYVDGLGFQMTEVVDPDGYHLFFESTTDAPEESEFAE
jgi:hypothetical protein